MALTNYISQSIICTILFFGIGFGLFGQIDRWIQIIISFTHMDITINLV